MLSLDQHQGLDLGALFVAQRSQLKAAAIKILGNTQRAEDVVQDAYVKLIETPVVAEVRQPVAYLFQVVRNLAIDRHRRSTLETQVFANEEDGLNVPHQSGTPETQAMHRQQLRMVSDALATLPERTRRAFELYRLGGLTQREVADELGISTTLVNFMIRDALTCCRDALGLGVGLD